MNCNIEEYNSVERNYVFGLDGFFVFVYVDDICWYD